MGRLWILWAVVVAGAWGPILGVASGQDGLAPLPTLPVADTGTVPPVPQPVPVDPVMPPPGPTSPEPVAPWTWQHQTQNQSGTVSNQQTRTVSRDAAGYDYQRQMTHTFRDGRTMEKTFTRTYDGTTGTMERSFVGPNGQVQHFQRPWTPDDSPDTTAVTPDGGNPIAPLDAGTPGGDPVGMETASISDAQAPAEPAGEGGLWGWLNPFKKRPAKSPAEVSDTGKRGGFTIGSFGRSRGLETLPPGQARKASGSPGSSQGHSMKPSLKPIGPPTHVTAGVPGKGNGKTH
ncbi:MAG: hypothetical protein ACYC6Y_02545 [Thermoguttaceae bacterium]